MKTGKEHYPYLFLVVESLVEILKYCQCTKNCGCKTL